MLFARQWKGAQGLAEDVRYYGKWMRDEAEKRIGHLYPKVMAYRDQVTGLYYSRPEDAPNPQNLSPTPYPLTVIAWLWARTVKSPNPAFAHVDVPLASTFMLSTKPGKEAYVEPVFVGDRLQGIGDGLQGLGDREREAPNPYALSPITSPYRFAVRTGKPKDPQAAKNGTKLARGANFRCLMSGAPITGDYIKAEGKAGRMGARLMAIVAEGDRGRVYLSPTPEHEAAARQAKPEWRPEVTISGSTQYLGVKPYGMDRFDQLFTDRQLVALTTFSDLVGEAMELVKRDAQQVIGDGLWGIGPDGRSPNPDHLSPIPLSQGGTGATAYAEAVGVYLAICVSRQANRTASLNFWDQKGENVQQVFARQALPMTWDFVEANPLSSSTGNFVGQVEYLTRVVETTLPASHGGVVQQRDAQNQDVTRNKLISTDPPYYDNVPYADLSDFFYVWLRRSLKPIFPALFSTLAVPKAEELVAFAYRHGGKGGAEAFFLDGMTQAMHRLAEQSHPAFPVTIYYAFKQQESAVRMQDLGPSAADDQLSPKSYSLTAISSTGWETFLDAVIRAGFAITGTWPMRTEYTGNLKKNMSALASSIVLVCRKRAADAPTATRREFVTALKAELPAAIRTLQGLPPHPTPTPYSLTPTTCIAPVDLAQAAIGPGMAVYTRYSKVLDAEGNQLTVSEALALINQTLDEALAEQEGDFDADSRWALAWFEQHGFAEGEYGVAETLSKAKNTSVAGMVEAGIVESKRGKVRLLKPNELPDDWDPTTDTRLTSWEIVHHLIRVLEAGGEGAAAKIIAKLGAKAEVARELCYRLYTICERKKRAAEALAYNGLVQSWPEITRLAREEQTGKTRGDATGDLFG